MAEELDPDFEALQDVVQEQVAQVGAPPRPLAQPSRPLANPSNRDDRPCQGNSLLARVPKAHQVPRTSSRVPRPSKQKEVPPWRQQKQEPLDNGGESQGSEDEEDQKSDSKGVFLDSPWDDDDVESGEETHQSKPKKSQTTMARPTIASSNKGKKGKGRACGKSSKGASSQSSSQIISVPLRSSKGGKSSKGASWQRHW